MSLTSCARLWTDCSWVHTAVESICCAFAILGATSMNGKAPGATSQYTIYNSPLHVLMIDDLFEFRTAPVLAQCRAMWHTRHLLHTIYTTRTTWSVGYYDFFGHPCSPSFHKHTHAQDSHVNKVLKQLAIKPTLVASAPTDRLSHTAYYLA